MADIRFKKFQAIPLSKTPAKILIRWEVDVQGAQLADLEFYIDRSTAQDSMPGFQSVDIHGQPLKQQNVSTHSKNLQPITLPISGLEPHWFLDFSQELRNLSITPFYRIRVRRRSTQEEYQTPMFGFGGELDLVGLYVIDETNFMLQDVTGVPSLVYVRKTTGIPCELCFDPVQKKRKFSNCVNCYSTNWVGGFFKPVDTYIDFSPDAKQVGMAQWGQTEENQSNLIMSNYPNVTPGDVIQEVQAGRMWRVTKVQETEKRRVPMLQMVRVTELKSGDVEYGLASDERMIILMTQEIEDIKKKREF